MNPPSSKTSIPKAIPQGGKKGALVVTNIKHPTKTALPLRSAEEESSTLARTTLVVDLVCMPMAPMTLSTITFSTTRTEAGVSASYAPTRTASAVPPLLTLLRATHYSSHWEVTRQWSFGDETTIPALATSTTTGSLYCPAMTRFFKMLACARSS